MRPIGSPLRLLAILLAILLAVPAAGCGVESTGRETQPAGGPPAESNVDPQPETVDVPDVTGEPADQAQTEIEAAGEMTVSWDPEEPPDPGECTVETQDTTGQVDPGAEVLLTVVCDPPDVTGMDGEEATHTLEGAGYSWAVNECSDRLSECVVLEQDPASEADPGAEISLTLESEETSGSGGGGGSGEECHESYPDQCLSPNADDYDCAEGSGDGPEYASGPLQVDHAVSDPDPYDLDRDSDGTGCDGG